MDGHGRKRALVTGAGTGIGRAVALELLRCGYDLALLGRRRQPLEQVAARADLEGGRVAVHPCDLTDRQAVDRVVAALGDRWDRVDAVVLNAGLSAPTPVDAPDIRAFDDHLELNLTAPFRLLRGLLPLMGPGGRIVCVASVLARFGVPLMHGYCASKAGLVGLVRALALDLARSAITVNAVLPAWVDTDMARRSIASQAPHMGLTPEEARARFEREMPVGRFLEPEEVAHAVAFLVSPRSSGITGQAVAVCGGTLA